MQLHDLLSGRSFYVFSSHFDHEGVQARRESARLLLRKIAEITGGVYYRVKSLDALKEGYDDIGRLEKARLEERGREEDEDMFSVFLAWAVFILLLDALLSNTVLRRIP